MNKLARITGIVLIVLGVGLILASLVLTTLGIFQPGLRHFARLPGNMPFGARPMSLIFLLAGAAMFVHGWVVGALGQGLYLLAKLEHCDKYHQHDVQPAADK